MSDLASLRAVEHVIKPRMRDLGGFSVGRVLPYVKRQMVGPFIFFDEMGPAMFAPGEAIDVRPHPHIGLATVTYLFDGEIRHKDNLGFDQVIRPGDVNWMTAGRGIVHSERTDAKRRAAGQFLHGIQSWVALPEADEEVEAAFHHHPKDSLPVRDEDGAEIRLILGEAFGMVAPVKTFSPIFYCGVDARIGGSIPLPENYEARALYLLSGRLAVDGAAVEPQTMLVFAPGAAPRITAMEPSRAMLLGGAPLGERRIWWNLVSTDQAKIDAAKAAWREAAARAFKDAGVFSLPPGETDYIPLPDGP